MSNLYRQAHWVATPRTYRIAVIVGLTFTILSAILIRTDYMLSSLITTDNQSGYLHYHSQHARTNQFYNDNETAFVFGAIGIYTTSELFKCMASIESLVRIGGWMGDVYLLMDDLSCIDMKFIDSLPNKNIHIKYIPDSSMYKPRNTRTDSNNPLLNQSHHRRLFNRQHFERSMVIKMNILDYLNPGINYAVWYDCDILFVIPGCSKELVRYKPPITSYQPIFTPRKNHVGSFIVKRDVSDYALQLWRNEIIRLNSGSVLDEKQATKDFEVYVMLFDKDNKEMDEMNNTALALSSSSSSSQVQSIHSHISNNMTYGLSHLNWHDVMPVSLHVNTSLIVSKMNNDSLVCAIHLTSGRCRQEQIKHEMNHFLNHLQLKSLENKQWCASVTRRHFKVYGVKWPFCWTPYYF